MIGRDGNRRVVTAADAVARAVGLRPGMPATEAQILIPGLITVDADPVADAEALERLALWVLQRISPIVAADPPDGIVIDSTGADHLHDGEATMIETLIGRLAMSGVTARAAVADTWGAAHALARFAAEPSIIAPPGHGAVVLDPLPLAALRLPPGMAADLRVLGFERVRDLLAQPRAPLTLRFGPEFARRLNQALGDVAEPIEPIRPPDLIEVRRAFGSSLPSRRRTRRSRPRRYGAAGARCPAPVPSSVRPD